MKRCHFLNSTALVPAVPAPALSQSSRRAHPPTIRHKTWLFWDHWYLDQIRGAELRQGEPVWRKEATYLDPMLRAPATWPFVYLDDGGTWRMLFSQAFGPKTVFTAESADGLHWKPTPHPEIQPPGKKLAPHHVFTFNGSCGGIYRNPVPGDPRPFKMFGLQHGSAAATRARQEKNHPLERYLSPDGKNTWMVSHATLTSADGLRWQQEPGKGWGKDHWYPEPPNYVFYNDKLRRHTMIARTGQGERRPVIFHTEDWKQWSDPELLFQPDPMDPPLMQFYGMPVFPYEGYFVGFLWLMYVGDSEPLAQFNHQVALLKTGLCYSFDGVRFQRGFRKPFIDLNEPGEHGSGLIETSCMTVTEDEIRIYSSGAKNTHGTLNLFKDKAGEVYSILLHTLRRDGFMYISSVGNWGNIVSKPLVLEGGELLLNASAPQGEIRFQLTDVESRPIAGFTFDDCIVMRDADHPNWPVQWRGRSLSDLKGKALRLELSFRHARLYALRADYHFIDAHDYHLLRDGKPIDRKWFDY